MGVQGVLYCLSVVVEGWVDEYVVVDNELMNDTIKIN